MGYIEEIYGEVNKLGNFFDPNTKNTFKYLNDDDLIELANNILNRIHKSKYRTIIVSESGTAPLIDICKEIAKKNNMHINWFYFKTPRSKAINLYKLILYYLTEDEKNENITINNVKISRQKAILTLCNKIDFLDFLDDSPINVSDSVKQISQTNIFNNEQLIEIIKGTELYNIFNSPFLFFDEYVFSGTVLRNFTFYANLFSKCANFQLGAYCILLDKAEEYNQIAFALYSNETKKECYKKGIYPFEDRIDIIGYYYFINKENYSKINILKLKDSIEYNCICNNIDCEKFILKIKNLIIEKDLLNKLVSNCRQLQVKDFVKVEDIMRYILKLLEQKYSGRSEIYEFLDQSFELYAPIWLPMPKEFHYDYWKAFERIRYDEIENMCESLINEYIKNREKIINEIINIYINRKKEFFSVIMELLYK